MRKNSKIFVAGHRGLVGSAILRKLSAAGHTNIVTRPRQELDLLNQSAVNQFFEKERPEYVFVAAAKVGGILANSSQQADFLYQNIMIAANTVQAAAEFGTEKLLFLGSSCIYPREAPQPIPEKALLTGPLEPTNEGYAIAKIAGLKLCEMYKRQYGKNFISAMPTNLYGPGDNFHPTHSHVIPAMLRRFHEAKKSGAKEVTIWGSGKPLREFLHVDDLADALLLIMEKYEDAETINVGSGQEFSIRETAELIREVVGYEGDLSFDKTKPDGTPRKIVDTKKLHALGWKPKHSLKSGLTETYAWAKKHVFDAGK